MYSRPNGGIFCQIAEFCGWIGGKTSPRPGNSVSVNQWLNACVCPVRRKVSDVKSPAYDRGEQQTRKSSLKIGKRYLYTIFSSSLILSHSTNIQRPNNTYLSIDTNIFIFGKIELISANFRYLSFVTVREILLFFLGNFVILFKFNIFISAQIFLHCRIFRSKLFTQLR